MGKRRKSAKKIIEKSGKSNFESLFVKFPGKNIFPVTGKMSKNFLKLRKYAGLEDPREESVMMDYEKLYKLINQHGKNYSFIHTHPTSPLPSSRDFLSFLNAKKELSMVIAQKDIKNGEVKGYFFLKKVRERKKGESFKSMPPFSGRKRFLDIREEYPLWEEDLNEICGYHNFKYRLVPIKGYFFDRDKMKFVKKEIKTLKNKIIGFLGFIGFISGLAFLFPNLTGKTISNLTPNISSLVGFILFILGLIVFYFYLKNTKNINIFK